MNRNLILVSAVAAATLLTSAANASGTLDFNNPDYNGALSSQNDTNGGGFGNFATTYTSFFLSGTSTVDEVAWIGSYFNGSPATITGFTLNFYTNNAGTVGSLASSVFVSGNAGETFLGADNVGDPTFLYDTLITPTTVGAGTGWLSIVPDLGFPPQWGWETGVNPGVSYQDFFGTRSSNPTTESYALFGNAVPEPMSMAALGLGAIALIRKRKSAK